MTAEPSVRDRAAEVLRGHVFRTGGSDDGYNGICSHIWNNPSRNVPMPLYSFDDHTLHQADALAAAGLLAGEADLGERIAARIEHEAATDASPQMLKLCGGTADTDAYWDGVIQGKRRAAIMAREVTR